MDTNQQNKETEPKSISRVLKEQRQREQEAAAILTFIVVLTISAALFLVFSQDISAFITPTYRSNEVPNNAALIKFFASAGLVAAFGLITYLVTSGSQVFHFMNRAPRSSNADRESVDVNTMIAVVETIAQAATEMKDNRFITQEDRKLISEELRELVRKSLPTEFLAKIDEKYGGAITNEIVSTYTENFLKSTKERLAAFQTNLSIKAASSLAWGLATAAIGLLVLGSFIIWSPEGTWEIGTVFHVIARLGLIALIEVVAFFFLSQYRFTLQDEKYVNNEITNAELRLLSVIIAAKVSSKSALEKSLGELSRTERNFALKKGEVSVFNSAAGADLLQSAVVADLIARLLPTSANRSTREKKQDA